VIGVGRHPGITGTVAARWKGTVVRYFALEVDPCSTDHRTGYYDERCLSLVEQHHAWITPAG
jgi:hypothetical protein